MKNKNRLKGMSLLLSAALLTGGCGRQTAAPESTVQAAAVRAVSPEVGTLTVSNQFVGTVTPQQQVSIIPLVSGVIDAVYADVGDEVSAGQVLFHIEDDAARLQAESASANKMSAEASAKMQLGSAQVMNNISMESNIRSIEYQIETARDQYNSAVDGVQDAQEARDDLKKAEGEINDSIDGLQNSYKEMKGVIAQAKQYIEQEKFRKVYDYPYAPDHYDWSQGGQGGGETQSEPQESSESTQESSSVEPSQNNPADESESGTQENESQTESGQESTPQTESVQEGTPQTESVQESTPQTESERESTQDKGAQTDNGVNDGKTSAEAADVNAGQEEKAETEAGNITQEKEAEQSDGQRAARSFQEVPFEYFDVEIIHGEAPVYLAAATDDPRNEFATMEEAWAAYAEQQKIDILEKAVGKMGYSASDIENGRADADMKDYASRIAQLQEQSAQIRSSKSSLDNSIKSGESAENSTKKAIDFYQDNLKDAQTTYGIQNGQAYQDTADALAAQIAAADVGVRSAQLQLEYYAPVTPISGTVVSRSVELYGLAQTGYAAFVISNKDAMNITFMVSGQVRNNLYEGMAVTLEKDGETFPGTITEIGETVDAQSGGLFTVKAVTEAGGDRLLSGAAVKLTVDTFRTDNALLIPYDAVHFESEQAYVFQIVEGKAVRTPVTIGLMKEDTVEVTEGLSADSRVIATWSSQLEDGAAVRVIGEEGAAE